MKNVPRSWRRGFAAATMVCLTAAAPYAARAEGFLRPPEPSNRPFSSATQHYIFRTLHAEDQAMLARWFEEIEVRVGTMTGLEVPFKRAEIIRASGLSAPPASQGDVRLSQGHVEGLLHQKLVLVNPEAIAELDVAEALMLLLLNRYVLGIQTRRGPDITPFQIPDWLTAGMTQNLQRAWRDRNAHYIATRWQAGRGRTVQSVFRLTDVDRMRSDERAFCGIALAWMTDDLMDARAWEKVFVRLADGETLDPVWLRKEILGFQDERDMEKSWDLWLASKTLVRRDLGTVNAELLEQLRSLLRRAPQDVGLIPPAGTPADLRPGDLIERRDQSWIRPYTTRVVVDLDEMASGKAPEFQEVVNLYREYYAALIRAAGERGGLFARSSAGAALRAQLDGAEQARAELESTLEVRGAYLEGVESDLRDEPPPGASDLRRERMDFLQGVEKRLAP